MLRLARFLIFFFLMVGLLVFVILPAAISPVLTQAVRDMGLKADDLQVSVDPLDPALLTGRATHLYVRASNLVFGRAKVGRLDLTLGNVSFFDRSFESVDGQMDDVGLAGGGMLAQASQVAVAGPATDASATGQFDSQESEDLVKAAARRVGVTLDSAQVVNGGLRLERAGVSVDAGISVEGGALVLRPASGVPILLLQPATSDPWQLDEAYVSASGITVRASVDAARIASSVTETSP